MRTIIIAVLVMMSLAQSSFADEQGFDRVMDKLSHAQKAGRWKEAITLSTTLIQKYRKDDYLSVEDRLSDIGQFHLNLLEFDAAAKVFHKLIASGKDQFGLAALGLARISAEAGKYDTALIHLEGYAKAWGSGCGNCLESRNQFAHLFKTVWQYAQLPAETATLKLKAVINGDFQGLKGRLTQEASYQKLAAREAKLILAGMMRREGKIEEANALYRELVKGNDEPAIMAKAYLARKEYRI